MTPGNYPMLPGEVTAHLLYRVGQWLIAAGFRVVARTGWTVALCSQCGPVEHVDEDGCCAACGCSAVHDWHLPTEAVP
jgi:hypothetical protein